MALRVIGAGFGRTGTDSMREALNILGLGPCHHMYELRQNSDQQQMWRAMAAGGPADWDRLFEGYGSAVDWPSAHYWRELMAVYPEAKVLLTWRTPESWWASVEKTILRFLRPEAMSDPKTVGQMVVAEKTFGGRMHEPEHAMAVYRANVEAVLAGVPAGRLIVHRLGDGWGPLCAQLGLPVPEVPYPHSNSTAHFNTRAENS